MTRNWSDYNLAQVNEIEKFDELLRELVDTIPDEEQTMGRPRLPIQDQVYCAVQKVYYQRSSRRSQGILRQAEEDGMIAHAPHFNAVSKFLNREDVTPLLVKLIRMSAAPLALIEQDFAIDSSGFRTTTYSSWCGEKHGEKKQNVWLKAHVCVGVMSNIVVDVAITHKDVHDSTQFKNLVEGTMSIFDVREISADKGYLSRENYQFVENMGAQAFIDFKKNSRGLAKGCPAWRRAFYHFETNKEDFYAHYHKRSNVETSFMAIKQKHGETLRSKNTTAQVNELLCKILAYNITVLIRCMYCYDVIPTFGTAPIGVCT